MKSLIEGSKGPAQILSPYAVEEIVEAWAKGPEVLEVSVVVHPVAVETLPPAIDVLPTSTA